ncbi:MAG: hypothetical protein K1Y36_00950 [Blastocatellia bacterium]|nr:hypothetical protein [Blastocatellia bacterium]
MSTPLKQRFQFLLCCTLLLGGGSMAVAQHPGGQSPSDSGPMRPDVMAGREPTGFGFPQGPPHGGGPPFGGRGGGGQDRRGQRPPHGEGPPDGPPDGPPPDGRRGPRQGGGPPGSPDFRFLSSEMRYDGEVVKGAPFSAQVVTKITQTLADGTTLTRENKGFIARDKDGRTRRERSFDILGPFATNGTETKVIVINDPVAGVQYHLDPNQMKGRRFSDTERKAPPPPPQNPEGFEEKTESLGKKSMNGVEVEGTRTVATIPAGAIGNDRPIQIVSERWYAPALKLLVYSTHKDPRLGATVFQLTNLSLKEPDSSLFTVPPDFRIKDDDGQGGKRHKDERRPRPDKPRFE